ncbi:16741_t:CDS:2, partial [Acaulospora colombiana]
TMNPFEGQVPGGVLKTVVDEHQFMDEFIQLLKRRNRDLAALCDTFNPNWEDSAIYPLVFPILAFFKNGISEITTRDTTCESIKAILDEIPTGDSPDKLEEGGSMLGEYQKLIDASERVKECKEIASSRDSVAVLHEWLNNEAPKSKGGDKDNFTTIRGWSRGEIAGFILPESARKVLDWHSKILPVMMTIIISGDTLRLDLQDVLERHQTRSENIKAALQKIGNSYSEQSNWIVKHVSGAKDRLNAFSSVDWIAPKHEGQSLESNHELMQIASYVNSVTGESSSVVVYGLKLEQVEFMDVLRMKIETLSV